VREHRGFPQKALRETVGQRGRRHQFGKANPRQVKKTRRLIGEFMGRKFHRLPHFLQRLPGPARLDEVKPGGALGSGQVGAEQVIVKALQGVAIAGRVWPAALIILVFFRENLAHDGCSNRDSFLDESCVSSIDLRG
jgi:hypothetical protein